MSQTMKQNEPIPQLVSIVPLKSEGKLLLKKAVRLHLGLNSKRTLYLETKNEIIETHIQTADNIIFKDARYYFKNKKIPLEEKIIEGAFSEVVKSEINKKNYDLILMGFDRECVLNYRLFNEVNIPIWVESKGRGKSILAVCSNLAPNQKVPDLSMRLADFLDWNLNMIYVVDSGDNVQVDENGIRSEIKQKRDLISNGKMFIKNMNKKGIEVKLIEGSLEKETIKAADNLRADLVIVGREQKKKNIFGFPTKNVKRKIAEKCKYSVLFVN